MGSSRENKSASRNVWIDFSPVRNIVYKHCIYIVNDLYVTVIVHNR